MSEDGPKDTLRIKVSIGNRVYPLTIRREEEERLRQAAQRINDMLRSFENSYAVQDKQDLLAMCALQFAAQAEQTRNQVQTEGQSWETRFQELTAVINRALE